MVAMAALRGTIIRYTRLLFHLVCDDLAAGIEEGGDSSDHRFHGVVDLVQSTCVLDAFVSRWHFDNKIGTGAPISLEDAFDMFCQGCSPFGPFWDHHLQYWNESLARPQEVMFLRYEEIVSDPLKVVRNLACFLGVPFTEEEEKSGLAEQIVRFCSFDSLRNLDANKAGGGVERAGGKIFLEASSLFRKGKVGDWVNHMSKDMGEKMDLLVKDKFKGSGLEF
uniref:Uncharacterized protein n=1 Tax=Avena sativa TaxID=4498 RepID=A0ACD5ZEX1_AVESA